MAKLKVWNGSSWEQIPNPAEVAGEVASQISPIATRVDPGASASTNSIIANVSGVAVWTKMPVIDPTLAAFGLSELASDTANDTALLAAINAANEAGATVRVPSGEFPIRQINAPYGTIIEGAGKENTKFVRSVGNSSDRFTFKGIGSLGSAISLTANTASGASSFTVASDPGLVSGDIVYVTDLRAPWGGSKYPGMDMARVMAVTGSGPYTVILGEPLYHPFTTANSATMQKVDTWRGGFHGFTIDTTGVLDANGVYIEYGGPKAEVGDVHVEHWTTTSIAFLTSYRSKADRTSIANPETSSSGYGYGHLIDMGSRGVDIGFGESRGARHGFDVSGGSSESVVHDCVGHSPSVGPDFGTHGVECYYNSFVNCSANVGSLNRAFAAGNLTFGGDFYTHFDRCTGYGSGPSGDANVMFRALNGSHHMRMTNCNVQNGYYGAQFNTSDDCTVTGSFFFNTRAALFNQSSRGATFTGNYVDTTVISAVQSANNLGSCDGMIVVNNQGVNTSAPFTNLVGSGHQTSPNVLR